MAKEIWLNLPVKNIQKSKEFFTNLGFTFNDKHTTEGSACMVIGDKNVVIMLFTEPMFAGFIKTTETQIGQNEILISFSADSKAEVDAYALKAEQAGGTIFGQPATVQGWMYGCGFADIDGHKWNILYMDMEAMAKK